MTSPLSSPKPQYPQAPRGLQSPQPPNGSRSRMVLLLAGLIVVVVVAAVVFAAILYTRGSRTASEPATTSPAAHTPMAEPTSAATVTDTTALEIMHGEVTRDPNDPRAKGDVNAPVVMVIYSDFACPFCTKFAQEVEPRLDDLIENGTLRIEWRDLAQVTQTSPLAAQAGIAAGKQGKFWEFHDAVYGAADPQGHPEYTEDSLVDFAEKAGVPDLERFRADMTDAATVKAVTDANQHAYSLGIKGTPFFFVNDAYIGGYRSADYVRATVLEQAALAK